MRNLIGLVSLGAAAALLGCSDNPSVEPDDVTGHWCGKEVATSAECVGDEVEYLELTQAANGVVTGVNCEAFGKECYDVKSGSYANGRLTYYYTFDIFRVDGDFTGTSANTLTGALHSDKCGCDVPITLHRVP